VRTANRHVRLIMWPVLLAVSCVSRPGATGGGFLHRPDASLKPIVAVVDFENKASFSGQWNLGAGMADLLVNRLVESERVVVLERQHLGDVVGEIVRQGQELFRSEGRAQKGRLKNAQYLIRGVVTDFTVTGDTSGWFGTDKAAVRGRGQRARVALTVKVSDVATGEILSSVRAEGEASSGGLGAAVNYKGVSFGGDAFFRTPLGKATEAALSRAVKKILHDLPVQSWQPRVADMVDGLVVVNGGTSVGVRAGMEFAVRGPPREIKDPVTGNTIDLIPGKVSGRIRIQEVKESASYAELLEGSATRGDVLERVK
jgi:curli biogenesis system outer membrane secretion channel CsgG